jgi:hypothetical protein
MKFAPRGRWQDRSALSSLGADNYSRARSGGFVGGISGPVRPYRAT